MQFTAAGHQVFGKGKSLEIFFSKFENFHVINNV